MIMKRDRERSKAFPTAMWHTTRRKTNYVKYRMRKCSWPSLFLILLNLLYFIVLSTCTAEGQRSEIIVTGRNATASALLHRHRHHAADDHQRLRKSVAVGGEHSVEMGDATSNDTTLSTLTTMYKAGEESYSREFWILVAQAKAMAISIENGTLPRLNEKSQIMNQAACRNNDAKCKDFVSKCSYEAAQWVLDNSSRNSSNGDMSSYMETIWNRCAMNHYLPTSLLLEERSTKMKFEKADVPRPIPMFHCNSHVASEKFRTNFRMEYNGSISPPSGMPSEYIPRYFVIEKGSNGQWEMLGLQSYWLFRIETTVNETFQIRVTAVTPKYVYPPVVSPAITIYDSVVQTIGKPTNLHAVSITVDNGAARPSPRALIRWCSGSGFNASCDFDVFYMDEDMEKVERNSGDTAFWVVLDTLQFKRNYTIKVIEKFGGNRESNASVITVHIPSCLQLRGYSFQLCPPPPPTKVRLVNATEDTFWIMWDPPRYMNASNQIINYNLTVDWIHSPGAVDGKLHTSSPYKRIFGGNIPGNVTAVEITNMTQHRGQFKVAVTAVSSYGPSIASWDVVFYKGSAVSTWTAQKILTLFFALFGVATLIGLFCLLKNFQERHQRKKKRKETFEGYDEKESIQLTQIDRDVSKWEIDCCRLILGDAIGQGNFGLVRRAVLLTNGRRKTVAVKTLRDVVNDKDVEKFWEEFEILKNLDPAHTNVVGLVGIVKRHVPLLVVEYCDGGDLLNHLRRIFQTAESERNTSTTTALASMASTESSCIPDSCESNKQQVRIVQNVAYFMKKPKQEVLEDSKPEPMLTMFDLLSYARQIACGMEFLSANKIVHRDLAARNILVSGKNRILKISDFGLSRDVYEQNWYKKTSIGNMPVKWLAIESLLKDVYTTKSDVWSYGVLLWEIFTHGGSPYPGIDSARMFELLKEGYRMSTPDHCPDDLKLLMESCWYEEPIDRPDFISIRRNVEDIITNLCAKDEVKYLNLEPVNHFDQVRPSIGPMLPPRMKHLSKERNSDDSFSYLY